MLKKVLNLFLSIYEDLIRGLNGSLGKYLRRLYYKSRLGNCGNNLVIDTGVFLMNPKNIFLGNNVWIDKQSILIAGKAQFESENTKYYSFPHASIEEGQITIGNNAHLGINSIIQGHGGVAIGNDFTLSAGCKIYSFSNDPKTCQNGTHGVSKEKIGYIMSPVIIENNVWCGLNCSMIGGTLRNNTFVKPNSVISGTSIPENSIAGGNPATHIKQRFEE